MLSRALIHFLACSTIAWLYVHDFICMIVFVWLYLYDCVTMRVWCLHGDHKTIYVHIQLVTTCNPQWLRVYEFILVACRRFINNVVNSRTELWTQKFATWTQAHYVFALALRHGNASHTWVQHHCMVVCVCLYVYDCICIIVCVVIVWQCGHDVMMTDTRSYTLRNSVSSNMIAFVSIHVSWDAW